jgi:putative SOS response-associated peptidase YedK
MCNRYSLSKKQERIITREYGSVEFYFMQRFNIAPTQKVQLIVVENCKLVSREIKWGWTTKFGLMTNARLKPHMKRCSKRPSQASGRQFRFRVKESRLSFLSTLGTCGETPALRNSPPPDFE